MKARGLGIVTGEGAPKGIGPYSQAVVVDGMVYTAGQIPLDPRTGDIVGKNTAEQTEQTLRNLAAVLQGAGSSLDLVVKTTVYLVDMADFPAMNEVYAKHFATHKPARSTVQAAALPQAGPGEERAGPGGRGGGGAPARGPRAPPPPPLGAPGTGEHTPRTPARPPLRFPPLL